MIADGAKRLTVQSEGGWSTADEPRDSTRRHYRKNVLRAGALVLPDVSRAVNVMV